MKKTNSSYVSRIFRHYFPKRVTEVVALLSLSTALFLFIHTRDLNARIQEYEEKAYTGYSFTGSNNNVKNDIQDDWLVRKFSPRLNPQTAPTTPTHYPLTMKLSAKELNNTAKASKEVLFFNRVPKVGSQTAMALMRVLSQQNDFIFHRDKTQKVEYIKMANPEQRRLALMIDMFEAPSVYVKHVCFVNFTKFNIGMPIYINIVRDPVERVISWYYYIRAPWYFVERKKSFPEIPLPDPLWLRKDYETCVLTNDPECQYIPGDSRNGISDHRRQTLFFCGHDDKCTEFNSEYALQQSKAAVEKHYAVVGVLENLNKTLIVLENYIPRFFKGAMKLYYDQIFHFSRINKNIYKPSVSEEVKNIVRKNFTREIEFYEFCKQRLHMQYAALNLPIN